MKRPRILITNDDGIENPGIQHLWRALNGFADLFIVAPATQKSCTGLSLTAFKPLIIKHVAWEDKKTPAWKINGTPADCVRLGLRVLLDSLPDLIVSGINPGSNAGKNVLYSGTVGGVTEGALRGIPGIAFSCVNFEKPMFEVAEKHILTIVKHFLEHPVVKGTIINVNFPSIPVIKGFKLTHQGQGFWVENPEKRSHPDGDFDYYWQGLQWNHHDEHEESDVALLEKGYMTAVPIHVAELTDRAFLSARKEAFEKIFLPK